MTARHARLLMRSTPLVETSLARFRPSNALPAATTPEPAVRCLRCASSGASSAAVDESSSGPRGKRRGRRGRSAKRRGILRDESNLSLPEPNRPLGADDDPVAFGIRPRSVEERGVFDAVLREARARLERGEERLGHAARRRNVKLYNRFMADAARAGCPSLVRRASERMDADGIEKNEYTASVLINALVRGGADLEEARAVLEEFERRGVRTNEAALVPLLQGTIEPPGHDLGGGDVEGSSSRWERVARAVAMVRRQLKEQAEEGDNEAPHRTPVPSRRTLDALLRGCKRWAPTVAPLVLRELVPSAAPSSRSSYGGNGEGEGDGRPLLEPSTLALLAEIACIDADPASASRLVRRMEDDWDISADTALRYLVATAHALEGDEVGAIGALQVADAAAEAEADRAAKVANGEGDAEEGEKKKLQRRPVPKSMLEVQRGMLMEYLSSGRASLIDEGKHRSGPCCHPFYDSPMISWGEDIRGGGNNSDTNGGKGNSRAAEEGLLRLIDQTASSSSSDGALHVEIGSGSGDWLAAQAAARPSDIYLGVEPRVDKVHQLWTRAVLRDLRNVHMFADVGEAVLGRILPEESVDVVHVRFPQPPLLEWHQLVEDRPPHEGYLGGGSFLDCAVRALVPGGELRIVTDNPLYCVLMTATVHWYNEYAADNMSVHRLLPKGDESSKSGLIVSPAQPNAADVSFFDALLADAGRKERYTLELIKE